MKNSTDMNYGMFTGYRGPKKYIRCHRQTVMVAHLKSKQEVSCRGGFLYDKMVGVLVVSFRV